MKNNGIFFDLYGTLFIFGDMNAAWNDWADAYIKCAVDFGNSINEKQFKISLDGFFTKPKPAVISAGLTIYEQRIKEQCETLKLSCDKSQLTQIATATTTAWQKHIKMDNDAIPLLKELKENFTLVLISNFDHPPHVYSLLADLELASLFEEIIISGEVGIDKPDVRIFEMALHETKLSKNDVWFVGDSVEDMEGAKSAGLKPVYINRKRDDDDHVIADFYSDADHPDRIQKQPDKDGVVEISKLTQLLQITKEGSDG